MKKFNKQILLKLDPTLLDRVDELRWQLRLNRSELIRLALTSYVNQREKQFTGASE